MLRYVVLLQLSCLTATSWPQPHSSSGILGCLNGLARLPLPALHREEEHEIATHMLCYVMYVLLC
jgi:hypothetical protein